jgi:excisionase family DNA binding protein
MSPATANEKRYMNFPAAARYTGMSEMTLRRLVNAGHLRTYKPTGSRLTVFDKIELDLFVHGTNAQEQQCPQP